MIRTPLQILSLLSIVGSAGVAVAVPPPASIAATDTDASVGVSVLTETIAGDLRSWCALTIDVVSDAHDLSDGDTVSLWVYEDGLIQNDVLWSTVFEVSVDEVAAGQVNRTFDCTGQWPGDPGDALQIFAEAEIDKATCGTLCFLDRPKTSTIAVDVVGDDDDEPNDDLSEATALDQGPTLDRISTDDDWLAFTVSDVASQVVFEARHDANSGPLDSSIFDAEGALINHGTDGPDGSTVTTPSLSPGSYLVRISPRNAGDANFYDTYLTIAPSDCTPGAEEARDCGDCGSSSRTCQGDGTWSDFGACTGEGVCAPGSEQVDSCGTCGTLTSTCNAACQWDVGLCVDGTQCASGNTENEACGLGTRTRTCEQPGCWGEYGPCIDPDCLNGEQRSCYEGPEATRGVGLCLDGTQRCQDGTWSECRGTVEPGAETCDGADNDCDGLTDEDVCSVGGVTGDPCAQDDDCAAGACVTATDSPQFAGGHCGTTGCGSDSQCSDDGICRSVFGQSYCLAACALPSDCRSGYLCATLSAASVCIPRCIADSQCTDPAAPACELATGLCIAYQPTNNAGADAGFDEGDASDAEQHPTDPQLSGASDDGCGCSVPTTDPASPSWWVLVGLAVTLLWRGVVRR